MPDMVIPPIILVMLLVVSAFLMVMMLTVMRWPTIPAYFIAGIAVGPSGINVLQESGTAHFVAELGVIFLLFTIGLKFSLSALKTIRRYVFVLGGGITLFAGALFFIPVWWWTGEVILALLVGAIAAMSSTAIVSQILVEENILTSPIGNRAMGILLFQDLAVIPLIVIFSSSIGVASLLTTIVLVSVKVAVIMLIVLSLGAPAMTRWLNWVANFGSRELYMLNLIMIIGLFSGISAWLGLSYALGAFVGGILMSETMHRYRVSRIVEPFRHIFLGFFFMSLGILVDFEYLQNNWLPVMGATLLLLSVKFAVMWGGMKLFGSHFKTALYSSLLLCGAGEFGFVLLTLAYGSSLVNDSVFQLLLSANLMALIVVPFLWRHRHRLIVRLVEKEKLIDIKKMTDNISQTMNLSDHVVICGFGRTGQAIAGILRDIPLPYVALEENYQILQTVGGTDNVIYAEAASVEGLAGGNIYKAKVLIVSFVDQVDSKTVIERAREINNKILIIARANTASLAKELKSAGADYVYIDAHEIGFSSVKQLAISGYGIRSKKVGYSISRARDKENPFFTGEFSADISDSVEAEGDSFVGCVVRQDMPSLESSLQGCRVISWLRAGQILDVNNTWQAAKKGDEVVLSGSIGEILDIKYLIENVEDEVEDEDDDQTPNKVES